MFEYNGIANIIIILQVKRMRTSLNHEEEICFKEARLFHAYLEGCKAHEKLNAPMTWSEFKMEMESKP